MMRVFHQINEQFQRKIRISDFIEAALQFYIAKLKRTDKPDKDIEIINRNADYLNQETQDALQYQAE